MKALEVLFISTPLLLWSASAPAEDGGTSLRSPGCPTLTPAEGQQCADPGLQCTYAPTPECGSIWQCYLGEWRRRAATDCAQKAGVCPKTLNVKLTNTPARLSCIYEDGTFCTFRSTLPPEPRCSGVKSPPSFTLSPEVVYGCERLPAVACELSNPRRGRDACEPNGAMCGRTCCGAERICVDGGWVRPICPPIP